MSSSAPVRLLALDTATEQVHLALVAGPSVHACVLPGGAQASAALLPALQALLAQAALGWHQLDALAFGRGPGAFTGLRTACAVAQGLALGLDKPVLSLDTLMAVAEAARQDDAGVARAVSGEGKVLWALQDARMSEVYAGPYRWDAGVGGWEALAAPVLWSLDHLAHRIEIGEVQCAAGSALAAYPDHFKSLAGPGVEAQPHGRALAALAARAWAQGQVLDAALALPLYVRDKVAQTTQERRAAVTAPMPASGPGGAT